MPKKKNQESQEEQSERFKKTVAELVAAGELNPTEADEAMDRLVLSSKKAHVMRPNS
jgi:polyhydroxyalkanoate synthesis regulator phasin